MLPVKGRSITVEDGVADVEAGPRGLGHGEGNGDGCVARLAAGFDRLWCRKADGVTDGSEEEGIAGT